MSPSASTRDRYGEVLLELGRRDPNVVVIGGDLNKSVGTIPFSQQFPERFFDLGAAEQNMVSIAAGLAASGKVPFVSTFAVFATGRAYDQLRVGVAQSDLGVKVVVTHAGLITGEDGISAQSIEDLALMCALPTFRVVVPADAVETAGAVRAAAATPGPFYIRLSRPATEVVLPADYQFRLGKAHTMREGNDATIIACGIMVAAAMKAADALARSGVQCRVLNMSTLRPIDEQAIVRAAAETGAIVTAEEHLAQGGLGAIIASVAGQRCPVPVRIVAVPDGYAESGKPDELLARYHLTPADVEAAVRDVLQRKGLAPRPRGT